MPKRKTKKQNQRAKQSHDDWKKWQESQPVEIKELWKTFSRYIRLRDCIKTTGSIYKGRCRTCGRIYQIGKLQAGHFVPGRATSILFDEDCAHAQCYRCNVILGGNWPKYYKFMQQEYGQEMIEYFIDSVDWQIELTEDWIKQSLKYYKQQNQIMNTTWKLPEENNGS